ncbi:hypothetical protein RCO48_25870 [Peribacillus frigoritolerans]|nr:hypothetical protein [Peribacillus frigoritolerans]
MKNWRKGFLPLIGIKTGFLAVSYRVHFPFDTHANYERNIAHSIAMGGLLVQKIKWAQPLCTVLAAVSLVGCANNDTAENENITNDTGYHEKRCIGTKHQL